MIVLTQIKAARALLGWTQENLAKVAKLSLPAVNNLERGLTTPRRETLE
ncbi:MAG: helix-turn-helix transcriptional regulator, partial [Alphaproteobacteria bacterium]|nr:helix-turn-helix transcriptional regulator [Alphaproteobacteria bacterium]